MAPGADEIRATGSLSEPLKKGLLQCACYCATAIAKNKYFLSTSIRPLQLADVNVAGPALVLRKLGTIGYLTFRGFRNDGPTIKSCSFVTGNKGSEPPKSVTSWAVSYFFTALNVISTGATSGRCFHSANNVA